MLRILTIGDIVGDPGVKLVTGRLPSFLEEQRVDFVVANAENASSGSGVTPRIVRELHAAGVDVVTTGDHVWKRAGIREHIQSDERLLRAANHKPSAPGRGHTVVRSRGGVEVGVLHVIGRIFMAPIDCPFLAADHAVRDLAGRTRVIVVDAHAEATSEKLALANFLDGRVSAVFGTHTHVPTADAQVLPKGTGYITDVGMTGPYRSVLGRRVEAVVEHFLTGLPVPFDVATEDVRLGAALFEVEPETGRCLAVSRVELHG